MRPGNASGVGAIIGLALAAVVVAAVLTDKWWASAFLLTPAQVAEADPEVYIEKANAWELWRNWGGGVYFFQKKSHLNQQDYWPYSLLRFLSENEGKKVVAMSDGNHDVMVVVFENKEEKK